MDAKQILNASYLDILFEGKNKKYGGYELRKKYPRRAMLAGLLAILAVGGVFGAMLIKPKPKDIDMANNVPVVTEMKNLEPPPPLKENEPPPPPPPTAPPPVKPSVKFTVPEIKKDAEVPKEEKLVEKPKDEKVVVGKTTQEGSEDPNAIDPSLSNLPSGSGKPEPVVTGGDGGGKSSTEIFRAVQNKATQPGNWNKYLSDNLRYPKAAQEAEVTGKVVVEFVVEKDGSITSVRVVRGKDLGNGLPEEAVRVVSAGPKWKPATQNGQVVRSYFTLPIDFKLQ
ncbi:MAG: energy transducer TonB [Sphingobacteriales bacterium]|nr:MAG: energy transducer TonB [Sphingobacteriales bacterium]